MGYVAYINFIENNEMIERGAGIIRRNRNAYYGMVVKFTGNVGLGKRVDIRIIFKTAAFKGNEQ
jgi:hypothetical protein